MLSFAVGDYVIMESNKYPLVPCGTTGRVTEVNNGHDGVWTKVKFDNGVEWSHVNLSKFNNILSHDHYEEIAQLKAQNARLADRLNEFFIAGSDGCSACETGRVTYWKKTMLCYGCLGDQA